MPHHDWPDHFDPDPGHGPLWHVAMSILTIAGLLAVAALVAVALEEAVG